MALIACADEAQKSKSKTNYIGNNPSQPVYSIVPASCGNDATCNQVLVGGQGDLCLWDLISNSCRIHRIPNFHTWFKHSTTVNLNWEIVGLTTGEQAVKSSVANEPPGKKFQHPPGMGSSSTPAADNKFDKQPITALHVSHNGEVVASGCAKGTLMVWWWKRTLDLQGKEPDPVHHYRKIMRVMHKDKVICLCLSRENTLLASSSMDQQVLLFDIISNELLHSVLIHMVPRWMEFAGSNLEESTLIELLLTWESRAFYFSTLSTSPRTLCRPHELIKTWKKWIEFSFVSRTILSAIFEL